MACYHPLHGYYSGKTGKNGKHPIIVVPKGSPLGTPILPCGRCIGCKQEYGRQWAIRIMHEAQETADNCWITLTYDEENLPQQGQLDKKHFVLFMKKLRNHNPTKKIRYYMCGEYGEKNWRPHYHACLFGIDFEDRKNLFYHNHNWIQTSEALSERWGMGLVTVGNLTFQSAAYTARYVTKKISGPKAEQHYQRYDEFTDEHYYLLPEYCTMSRGGKDGHGIGHEWYQKYKHTDCYNRDEIIINGRAQQPPRFYDKLFQQEHPDLYYNLKTKRIELAESTKSERTPNRLRQKEKCKQAKLTLFSRNLQEL